MRISFLANGAPLVGRNTVTVSASPGEGLWRLWAKGARWKARSGFHGKYPGLPTANCPQIHRPAFGSGVTTRPPLGSFLNPLESKERHADFLLTTRTVAWRIQARILQVWPGRCPGGFVHGDHLRHGMECNASIKEFATRLKQAGKQHFSKEIAYLSRPASCATICTGDNKYSSTVRCP